MTRTWRLLGLNTLLATMLTTAAPTVAVAAPPTDADKLDAIQKQVDDLKASLADIKKSLALLETINKRIDDLRAESNLGAQTARSQADDLKQQVAQLKTEIDTLRDRLGSATRVSGFAPSDTAPAAGTGRVEMINTYPGDITVTVNDRAYRLRPGEQTLSEPIPAGSFTYEVLGITPRNSRLVAANRVFTIHVHPQP
jgi:hypothetical protein